MKNNTLPNQFYLQQKIKSILEENGKNSTNAIYYLRELVKQNLILFREEFNDSYPNTVKSEDKKERKNQTVILSTKYFHDAYFKYITQDEISITLQENCLFLLDKKGNTRTIRDFIYENDYTEGKDYRVTIVLDFLSIALGFEGWKEAEKFDFDITKKPKKINKNKIAIKSNQETLHKIEDVKEIVLENQNNNKEEIKSEIKSNNLILEKVENNILNEVKNLKFDIHKSKLPKYLTIEMPIIYENEIIGLKNDLQDIYERLHKKNTLIINSIGGIGKTTLAAVYGTKNLNYYKHILWINKNSNHDFKNSLIKSEGLINNLQIKKEDKDLDDIFTEILIKLNSIDNHPCLMIIDNAEEDLNDYKNKLPNPPNWHILITSREKLSSFEDTEIKELNSLSPKLAVKLFKKHYERKNLDDKIIYNIVKDLDYHTLTIEIIAKTTKDLDKTPEFILNFLRSNPVANVKVRHSDKKIDRIHSYLCAVFQKLTKLDEENKRLLLILSFLPSNFLSYKKLKKLISIENKNFDLRKNLKHLTYKGWLIYNKKNEKFKLHRITNEVIKTSIDLNIKDVTKLASKISKNLQVEESYQEITNNIQWVLYGKNIISQLEELGYFKNKESDLIIASLQEDLAVVLNLSGEYLEAKELFESVLKIYDRYDLLDIEDKIAIFNNLSITNNNLGNYKESKKLLFKALKLAKKKHQSYSEEISNIYSNLSTVYHYLKDLDNSFSYLRKSFDIDIKIFGKEHPTMIPKYFNLATLLLDTGKLDLAKKYTELVITLTLKTLDSDHSNLVKGYHLLGMIDLRLLKFPSAKTYFKKSIHYGQKLFDNTNIHIAQNYLMLGLMYDSEKKHQKAVNYIQKTLEAYEKCYGVNNEKTKQLKMTLSMIMIRSKIFSESSERKK